jgi:hypothetical protein
MTKIELLVFNRLVLSERVRGDLPSRLCSSPMSQIRKCALPCRASKIDQSFEELIRNPWAHVLPLTGSYLPAVLNINDKQGRPTISPVTSVAKCMTVHNSA